MMASLVESASELLSASSDEERLRYITFSEAMIAAEELASPLYDLHEETWHELCLRPSPPVTPESLSPATGVPTGVGVHEEVQQDVAESLLCNIMEYEQIMEALHEAEFALTSTSDELLIQDCMWSSGTNCSSDEKQSNTCSMAPSSSSDINEAIKKPSSTHSEPPDCIEPSVVFPSLYTKSSKLTDSKNTILKSTATSESGTCNLHVRSPVTNPLLLHITCVCFSKCIYDACTCEML